MFVRNLLKIRKSLVIYSFTLQLESHKQLLLCPFFTTPLLPTKTKTILVSICNTFDLFDQTFFVSSRGKKSLEFAPLSLFPGSSSKAPAFFYSPVTIVRLLAFCQVLSIIEGWIKFTGLGS